MKQWIADYIKSQKAAHDSIPVDAVAQIIEKLRGALKEGRHVFVFGNGGSAANASHFATDLGKGSSDKIGKRFRVLSLSDNVSWMTALGNDYSYEDIFVGQLQNFGGRGDIALGISVSGNSPQGATVNNNTDADCHQSNNHPYSGSGNNQPGNCDGRICGRGGCRNRIFGAPDNSTRVSPAQACLSSPAGTRDHAVAAAASGPSATPCRHLALCLAPLARGSLGAGAGAGTRAARHRESSRHCGAPPHQCVN